MEIDIAKYLSCIEYLSKVPNSKHKGVNVQEIQDIQLFFVDSFYTNLKPQIYTSNRCQELLVLMINSYAEIWENNVITKPSERFTIVRIIPTLLFLLDGEEPRKNITKFKGDLLLGKIHKIYRKYPIAPLIGDMFIDLSRISEKSIGMNIKLITSLFGNKEDRRVEYGYSLLSHIDSDRDKYNMYSARFQRLMNRLPVLLERKEISLDLAKRVYNLVLEGFGLLSDWTSTLLFQYAWKLSDPKTVEELLNPQEPLNRSKKKKNNNVNTIKFDKNNLERASLPYELRVKYNYNTEERLTFVEYIGMIKGLAEMMNRHENIISILTRWSIHHDLQDLIQKHVNEIIRKLRNAKKKKKLQEDLLNLRFIGLDWMGTDLPEDDLDDQVKKRARESIESRPVRPSSTQLGVIRGYVSSLITHAKSRGTFAAKDIQTNQLKALELFYSNSFFYRHVLDYIQTIEKITDLSTLWYREYWLEQTESVQFPIDISFPWVLTEHVIDTPNYFTMMEFILSPLSIYNDAADYSINVQKKKFLFDEIEAETNLALDQLLYRLCDMIFTSYKIQASSIQLETNVRKSILNLYPDKMDKLIAPITNFVVLLEQRHFKLLGRSIDLNNQMSIRMTNLIRDNLDYAMWILESSSVVSILAFENLLENIRLTHFLMSKNLTLDPFENILEEVDQNVSLVSLHGKIALHVIFEIMTDLTPHFIYSGPTQRFIRIQTENEKQRKNKPPVNMKFLYGNTSMTGAFSAIDELTESFFGIPHIHALLRLLGDSMPLIIEQILDNMKIKLNQVIIPICKEIQSGIPDISLPVTDYGIEGSIARYTATLAEIVAYTSTDSGVYKQFSSWGNTISLLHLLDIAYADETSTTYIMSSPFLGVNGSDEPTPLAKAFEKLKFGLAENRSVDEEIVESLLKSTTLMENFYSTTSDKFSFLTIGLQTLESIVTEHNDIWCASEDAYNDGLTDNILLPVEKSNEFYRLWSVLQFILCAKKENLVYGDGLYWAGCTIIHLLQQKYRFEALDLGFHILRINDNVNTSKPECLDYLRRVKDVKDQMRQIFNILHIAYEVDNSDKLNFSIHPGDEFDPNATNKNVKVKDIVGTTAAVAGTAAIPPTLPTRNHEERSDTANTSDDFAIFEKSDSDSLVIIPVSPEKIGSSMPDSNPFGKRDSSRSISNPFSPLSPRGVFANSDSDTFSQDEYAINNDFIQVPDFPVNPRPNRTAPIPETRWPNWDPPIIEEMDVNGLPLPRAPRPTRPAPEFNIELILKEVGPAPSPTD
eukprot:TRINITY_DN11136_c0_g1_i1.p1 TRINITY_DN11136_c0_g1~~TRINITY_DN11136_c0_g1_i1.p1  ORF type:complete len:1442 (-),score=319.44 TRINITY_DN11136_c0_g1_i1:37-3855(-)